MTTSSNAATSSNSDGLQPTYLLLVAMPLYSLLYSLLSFNLVESF